MFDMFNKAQVVVVDGWNNEQSNAVDMFVCWCAYAAIRFGYDACDSVVSYPLKTVVYNDWLDNVVIVYKRNDNICDFLDNRIIKRFCKLNNINKNDLKTKIEEIISKIKDFCQLHGEYHVYHDEIRFEEMIPSITSNWLIDRIENEINEL